jgi:hypothetical protein
MVITLLILILKSATKGNSPILTCFVGKAKPFITRNIAWLLAIVGCNHPANRKLAQGATTPKSPVSGGKFSQLKHTDRETGDLSR